ncbi:unnamed protein product [Clonostachys rosea]|uniref:Leucine-rich repeat domain-containing protein n=1 Tax=Bionectria ochroleuca TaxID=29856 RepID=A0ABY6UZT9_BIOOC|nr:unnamed protein product [Clonostachys rosea]
MEQRAQVKKRPPTTLLTLPPEILSKILSCLVDENENKPDIQAVLRTCKHLHEIGLPISVSVFRNTRKSYSGSSTCSRVRNIRFIRYILVRKPWLAKHVKTVIIGRFSVYDAKYASFNHRGEGQDRVTNGELSIYREEIEFFLGQLPSGYTQSWCRQWLTDLKSGTSDAQFSLILLCCPNIRKLSYTEPEGTRHFGQLLRFVRNLVAMNIAIQTPGSEWGDGNHPQMAIPLSNVRDVFHETPNYKNGYKNFYLEAPDLLAFPRIRFYECILANGPDVAGKMFKTLPYRSSSVEEIVLHCSYLCPEAMAGMVGACKALKKFEFTFARLEISPDLMTPHDILEALLPHADTLEELYIHLEDNGDKDWDWFERPSKLYLGSGLHQLHNLKKLTVGMQALTGMLAFQPEVLDEIQGEIHGAIQGAIPEETEEELEDEIPPMPMEIEGAARIVESLPENLEHLLVRDCGVAIICQVEELLSVIEQGGRFKKLTDIRLIFNAWRMDMEVDGPEIEKLNSISTNVQLDIILQNDLGYIYDLGFSITEDDEYATERNIMSRINSGLVRDRYLESRGTVGEVDEIPPRLLD